MKTQFTLRQLFVCMAYFAVAFALVSAMVRMWRTAGQLTLWLLIVGFWGYLAYFALMGAGIGHLFGKTLRGVFWSVIAGLLLLLPTAALWFVL
jgi:hypothetical protein